MEQKIDTTCEHIKLRLIAAAVGLQQCTKTAANVILIPGGDQVIVIGTPAQLANSVPELRNHVLEEVAAWYAEKGWLLDESEIAGVIRSMKSPGTIQEGA